MSPTAKPLIKFNNILIIFLLSILILNFVWVFLLFSCFFMDCGQFETFLGFFEVGVEALFCYFSMLDCVVAWVSFTLWLGCEFGLGHCNCPAVTSFSSINFPNHRFLPLPISQNLIISIHKDRPIPSSPIPNPRHLTLPVPLTLFLLPLISRNGLLILAQYFQDLLLLALNCAQDLAYILIGFVGGFGEDWLWGVL